MTEFDKRLDGFDKKIIASIKDGAWADLGGHLIEIREKLLAAERSRSDKNWQANSDAFGGSAEMRLARAVAEGFGDGAYLADLPFCLGLLGENKGRNINLLRIDGAELRLFELETSPTAEDIVKGLRDLILISALYQVFIQDPAKFGYDTAKSPLLMEDPILSWEIAGPLDLINPKRSDLRWLERDIMGIQSIMKTLGVSEFSLSRFQADSVALKSNIEKDNFSANKARQWFENRTAVVIASVDS